MQCGFLVYKCRRCEKKYKNTHVPDGLTVLNSVINDFSLPKEWLGVPVSKTGICNCDDGNLGVSDLVGFERD